MKIAWNLVSSQESESEEEFQLIWFGPNFDKKSSMKKIEQMLLEINPKIRFYTDTTLCENFIKTAKDQKLILIIYGTNAKDSLIRLAQPRTVLAVFILHDKRGDKSDRQYSHPKVVGVFASKRHLASSIRRNIHQLEKQAYTFGLFNHHQKTVKDLSRESASFAWHQLLIHVLRQMVADEHAKIDMLQKCADYYRFDKVELKHIERFRCTYSAENAIHWYTSDSFVFKLLNRAFRTENIELIYAFRYFIIDLCTQLEHQRLQLDKNERLLLYRGQHIPNEEFDKLRKNVGKLISPNGFLSTSRDRKISIIYAGKGSSRMTPVLFEIEVNSALSESVIFADVEHMSSFPHEREVLFSIGSTFKIESIEFHENMSLWIMRLNSIDVSKYVNEYLKLATNEMKDSSPMLYFGNLLLNELGQIEQAKNYFNVLLKILPPDHPDMAGLYNALGDMYLKEDQHLLALEQFKKAYQIRKEKFSILHPCQARSLRSIADAYRAMKSNDHAFVLMREAIKINERNYSTDHFDVAMTFQNMGLIYQGKNYFSTALSWFEDALEIFHKILPSPHPQIAKCLGRIGNLYKCMGEYDRALNYFHQELGMDELCLPLDHIDVIKDFERLLDIYRILGAYDQGLKFSREKLIIYEDTLSESHRRCVNVRLNIINLLMWKSELDEALEECKYTLQITKNVIPMNSHDTIRCLTYMNLIYRMKKDLLNCLECCQSQLGIEKTTYPSNHCNIGTTLTCIGDLYYDLGNYTAAIDKLEEAVVIFNYIRPRSNKIILDIQRKINSAKRRQSFQTKQLIAKAVRYKSRSKAKSRSRSSDFSRSRSNLDSSDH